MIARIWHGYTSKENAEKYENLLTAKILKEIEAKSGEGFKGVQLLKNELEGEVEFTTMIFFRDLETIKSLTGEDLETAYIPEEARKLLSRFDEKVTHSRVIFSSKKD